MALLGGNCKAEIVPVRTICNESMAIEVLDGDLPIDSPERKRLPLLLRRAWYGLNQAFRRQISHAGATPDQFTALRTLSEGDSVGLTQSELTRSMSSDPNTVASLLERMEKNEWIERKPHETDRRAKRILLLPAGVEKYNELRDSAIDLQGKILTTLPESQRDNFLQELAKVADSCHGAAQEAGRKNRSDND
jgi:DNA-binding MarR family transcriptional regulator